MRYQKLFDGKEIPVVGLGTWTIGGGVSADRSRDTEHTKIVRRALETGYTHVDIAVFYADGHAEELVGEAVKEHCRQSGAYQPLGKGGLMRRPGVKEIAEESGFSPAQLAIGWILRKDKVITIPMSSRQDHLKVNLAAADIDLPVEIYQALEKLA